VTARKIISKKGKTREALVALKDSNWRPVACRKIKRKKGKTREALAALEHSKLK
jgi:pyrroline-5-carboxylate reductase